MSYVPCYGGKPHNWGRAMRPDVGPYTGCWIKCCSRCGRIAGTTPHGRTVPE